MPNQTLSFSRFSDEEMKPFLQSLSKLGPVTVVEDSPYSTIAWPHFCWLSTKELSVVTPALLARYPGRGSWTVFSDHPRVCLAVQPNFRKGESYAEFSARVGNDDPGMNSSVKGSFRPAMVEEISKLASYLEEALELKEKPTSTIQAGAGSLDLPHIEDQAGQGGGVILASDPAQFVKTGLATSPSDRAIHFWLTEDEERALYLELSKENPESSPLLLKICQSAFGGLILSAEQMPALAAESAALKGKTTDRIVEAALDKLLSICRSAGFYHLGVYIPGQ